MSTKQDQLFKALGVASDMSINTANHTLASALTLSTNGQVTFNYSDNGQWTAEGEIVTGPADNEIWYTLVEGGQPYDMDAICESYFAPGTYSTKSYEITETGYTGGHYFIRFTEPVVNMGFNYADYHVYPFIFRTEHIKTVTLPNCVKHLYAQSVYELKYMSKLTLGNSIEEVGDTSLGYNKCLYDFTLPESVKTIGIQAFRNCQSITGITIPAGVESIAEDALRGCVMYPENIINKSSCVSPSYWSIEVLGDRFIEKNNLIIRVSDHNLTDARGFTKDLIVPADLVTNSFASALGYLTLETITVEPGNPKYEVRENCNAVIDITGDTLIYACKNTTIPSTVTKLENGSFECRGVTSVTIPSTVTTINNGAFRQCQDLVSITLPNTITTISANMFHLCKKLKYIAIPNSVTTIGQGAFNTCDSLTGLTFPSSVTNFSEYAPIESCQNLVSITMENNGNDYYESPAGSNCIIKRTDGALLAACKASVIPDSVRKIGYHIFTNLTGITTMNIPEGVQRIDGSFNGCVNLATINLPATLTYLGSLSFASCKKLTDIYYNSTSAAWSAISVSFKSNWNLYCDAITLHCTDTNIIIPAHPA